MAQGVALLRHCKKEYVKSNDPRSRGEGVRWTQTMDADNGVRTEVG